ncbi:hypothetical protein LV164_000935 [Aspergillus fumigatus]|nr:hypothetical protein KXX42_006611 [Aspergillus fumigatus]KAH1982273.1 hypothetical protein KXW88_004768 [Aspergillus fumigatus]KAH2310974.1 hypothetical protein KXV47_004815 [Aspergillus fumigatus]KAH2766207.1 hypothetical protein KXV94_003745 [Aspergillus fumigatus]KAH3149099.1 hypothetical protein KXW18_000588 [Aspergillus fumigatus]
MSYVQVHLESEPHQADRQLQEAVHSTYRRSNGYVSHSRKHSRSSAADSDWPSDESGRFDDAEESMLDEQPPHSPSAHSSKRRRSNDWPLQPGEENPAPKDNGNHCWPFKNSSYGSPRRTGRQGGGGDKSSRGRPSRFIEAHMNDSVSEKPPSIFIRGDAGASEQNDCGAGQRSSGIFRFGRAIASAFNPFGVWGNVSDIWRGSQSEHRPEGDARARAEKAYAELKKAGYKGTVKGSYMQGMQTSAPVAEQHSRRASQAQSDGSKTLGRHSRQNSTEGYGSGSSIRSSLQELRKAKSSLGIPYIKRGSEDLDRPEVRKSRSRKELQRQAKLLKRVSDLEGKLERARRELRELTGEKEEEPVRTLCQERTYHRPFVPGALPTLPSERFYENNATTVPDSQAVELVALSETSGNIQRMAESQGNGLATVESPSLKRKSPDPKSVRDKVHQMTEDSPNKKSLYEEPARSDETNTPRKATKMGKSDSPGSVERKRAQDQPQPEEHESRGRNQHQPRRRSNTRSPSAHGRRSTSRSRTTPCLRMKQRRSDLRSAVSSAGENHLDEHKKQPNGENEPQQEPNLDYPIVDLRELDDMTGATTPTFTPSRGYLHERIPPVPPLPKNLAATAAKVDRRLARELWKMKNAQMQDSGQTPPKEEDFRWPEDIF